MRILISLFGAPIAWLVQLTVSETLTAHACYPYLTPLSTPLWGRLPLLLGIISISCLTIAFLSGFIAWKAWRQNALQFNTDEEVQGIEIEVDRSRFLIMLSLMSSFLFIVAVIFNSFAVLIVLPCSSWF